MDSNAINQGFDLNKIKAQAIGVITEPANFFRTMVKSGGFQDPLIFLIVVSIVTAVIRAVFMLPSSFVGAMVMMIVTPVFVAVFGFIGAAILYVAWNVMGSKESYETAYRCLAYSAAVVPITTLISYVPYLGGFVATAWGFYLIFVASVEVHRIPRQKAQMVWGIVFVLFALMGLFAEIGARKAQKTLDQWEQKVNRGEVTPEEMGKMMGEFIIGLEKAAEKQKQPPSE